MASLMENLIDTLEEEGKQYGFLLNLSMEKTQVIVEGNIVKLQKITEEEQQIVGRINMIDRKRIEAMKDIAEVLNKEVQTLTLPFLISVLSGRTGEQKRLAAASDQLKTHIASMSKINTQNKELLQNALEMVEFDLNLIKSMKAAPATAEYNRGAVNAGNILGVLNGKFDAKQ